MSRRRVQKEKKATNYLCTVRSLVMVREPVASASVSSPRSNGVQTGLTLLHLYLIIDLMSYAEINVTEALEPQLVEQRFNSSPIASIIIAQSDYTRYK